MCKFNPQRLAVLAYIYLSKQPVLNFSRLLCLELDMHLHFTYMTDYGIS